MSLKAFHIVFIVAAILLALGFGAWCFVVYHSHDGGVWYLVGAIGSLVAALALVVYERYFLKKLKNVSYI